MTSESGQINPGEFARALDVAQTALSDLRSGKPTGDTASEIYGEAEAADGLVRATITADGRVGQIQLQRKALKLGSEELAAAVVTAVNAARQDMLENSRASHSRGTQAWDPEQLLELQRQSALQIGALIQRLGEMADRLGR
jgi:DNA-binding protein YbaB